jgi:uncharacterized protein YdgA (DUF945 family)
MIASRPLPPTLQGPIVKKSVVVILVLLAAVVLVSPAIVGRLAEQSMERNLNWAAEESGEVTVTSEHFTRGWFSSEGQHRIELREGDLLTALQAVAGPMAADEIPVLVVSTRLDHGLIPVSSISRDEGSLAPGLGSAVSTMQVELADGTVVEVPGTIYSKVGLSGALHSHYVLPAGSREDDDISAQWDDVNIDLTTDPSSGRVTYDGTLGKLAFATADDKMSLDALTFKGQKQPTEFGVSIGDIFIEIDGLAVDNSLGEVGALSKMTIEGGSSLDGGDLSGAATMHMMMQNLPDVGEVSVDVSMTIAGADAATLARVQEGLRENSDSPDPMALYASVQDDLKRLFAAGFDLSFDEINITLPEGTLNSSVRFAFAERDPATFEWSTLLLSTEASANVSMPASLLETRAQGNAQVGMLVGGGFLQKRNDDYVMEAELKKGLLTINGAPMPLPLGNM